VPISAVNIRINSLLIQNKLLHIKTKISKGGIFSCPICNEMNDEQSAEAPVSVQFLICLI